MSSVQGWQIQNTLRHVQMVQSSMGIKTTLEILRNETVREICFLEATKKWFKLRSAFPSFFH